MSLEIRPLETPASAGYEEVWIAEDASASYRAIIAVHNTRRGPALGGTRLMRYASDDAALTDVLRLARGMTFKCAAANLPLGGGKSVILAPLGDYDRAALLRAHGQAVEFLRGRYVTSVDIGTGPEDMVVVRETTSHVTGLPNELGDPSPITARGVVRAMQAGRRHKTGSVSLAGVTVVVQGCGHVGRSLAEQLAALGAKLVVSDVDETRTEAARQLCNAEVCDSERLYGVQADIYAPCATGATLNDSTIPRLAAQIVAGAANNQLAEDRHDRALRDRGILYVPDFIANAGGAIYLCRVLAGWSDAEVTAAVEGIYDTALDVLLRAEQEGIGTLAAAERIVEARLH
jgi:leucine dehydrogenase